MLYLLRRNCEYIQNFDHYLHNYICHRGSLWYFRVGFKAPEKVLDTFEELGKGFFTCTNILGGLTDIVVKNSSTKEENQEDLTEIRTPTPAEITLAGENICEKNWRKIEELAI